MGKDARQNSRAAPSQHQASRATPALQPKQGARGGRTSAQRRGAGRGCWAHGLSNRCDLKLGLCGFPPSFQSGPLSAPARPRAGQHPGCARLPPDPTGGLPLGDGGAARGRPCCHGCCGLMQRRVVAGCSLRCCRLLCPPSDDDDIIVVVVGGGGWWWSQPHTALGLPGIPLLMVGEVLCLGSVRGSRRDADGRTEDRNHVC